MLFRKKFLQRTVVVYKRQFSQQKILISNEMNQFYFIPKFFTKVIQFSDILECRCLNFQHINLLYAKENEISISETIFEIDLLKKKVIFAKKKFFEKTIL